MYTETISRKYRGSPSTSHRKYNRDAKRLSRDGWKPISQHYDQGSWGFLAFLIALVLCIILIGILVFIYMLIVKPKGKGVLYVTYERDIEDDDEEWIDEEEWEEEELKTCPDCAENIKEAARVCRYCSYKFD